MPHLTVDLSDDAIANLGARARRHDQPLEDEARAVLEESLGRRLPARRRARRPTPPTRPGTSGELGASGIAEVEELEISESHRHDLRRAIEILKEEGCAEIYLFGSLVTGRIHGQSDIDLAVRGCPKKRFFRVFGELMMELDHPVDLVDLDCDDLFVHRLEKQGGLVQLG